MANNNSTILYVFRHGKTLWNKLGKCQGYLDSHLKLGDISHFNLKNDK